MGESIESETLKDLDAVVCEFFDTSDIPMTSREDDEKNLWAKKNDELSSSTIAERYAPLHLKEQFEDLYRVLHPALVDRRDKKNVSAFLQGARGSGKSLVLDRCLRAMLDEIEASKNKIRPFRIVRLNGVLVAGSHVTLCVQEILRQLTELAYQENIESDAIPTTTDGSAKVPTSPPTPPKKRRRRSERTKKLLRLRKSSFTNQIQLLNEILQFACLDGIPILFVLDELDAFVRSSSGGGGETFTNTLGDTMDRQLLLYHLLDRVATDSSLVSFVGITCHNGTMSMLEKRIRSRAEGTTRFIYFGPCSSLQEWIDIVGHKLQRENSTNRLHQEWTDIVMQDSNESPNAERQQILDCLQRSLNLGYSVRWLFRVISSSLMLYRHDLIQKQSTDDCQQTSLQSCLLQILASMGAPFLTPSGERDLILVDKVAVNDRIQTLRDLSGPQICLVLAARRILARDSHRESSVPLTLDRMLEEYKSYKGSSNRYSRAILWTSFRDLLAAGLIRPGTDHTGMAPLQYNADPSFQYLSAPTLGKIPLHLNLDIHRELQKAIDQKLLDCSAALQEWGKKTT